MSVTSEKCMCKKEGKTFPAVTIALSSELINLTCSINVFWPFCVSTEHVVMNLYKEMNLSLNQIIVTSVVQVK